MSLVEVSQSAAPITAVVVAGGRSTRLGRDKRRLRLWGEDGPTLLERVVQRMARQCQEVVVVLNDAEAWGGLNARLVADAYPGMGPLGGIATGLQAATHDYIFAVAGDMPLLSEDLIAWMIREPRDYDVLVPRLGATQARNRLGVESLHAIYGRACYEPIRRQLDAGNPQVIGFFADVRVRLLDPETIMRYDPGGHAFKNINTPQELDEVQQLIASGG